MSVKEPRRRHAKRLSELLGADEQIQSRLCFISCSWRLNCEIKVNNSVPSVRGRADFIRLRNISAIIVSSAAQQVENSECLNDVLFFFFSGRGRKRGQEIQPHAAVRMVKCDTNVMKFPQKRL